mmetsp:Transcript_10732/g.24480  ORF Transcript_10732/g.24480 Transcript_10732/m.24480 type:complete len:84 (+) Transcript_10732:121-372(+)
MASVEKQLNFRLYFVKPSWLAAAGACIALYNADRSAQVLDHNLVALMAVLTRQIRQALWKDMLYFHGHGPIVEWKAEVKATEH